MESYFSNIAHEMENLPACEVHAEVSMVRGLMVEIVGAGGLASVGERCEIINQDGERVRAEVVGFRGDVAIAMTFGELVGIHSGAPVLLLQRAPKIYPTNDWMGRVVNSFAEPIDGLGVLPKGKQGYAIKASPLPAHERGRVGGRLDLGVKSLNVFTTCCLGQRMGIFAGSGVGKSTMLAMIARNTSADVVVIGLVGERGREVQDFVIDSLGTEGLRRAVVVVSTSDEPALKRREAAYTTMAVSEYFRDQGMKVLCLMDSVTRFAMAQREIGLSVGEPPASKGYTPMVFAELPRLLERAGPGRDVHTTGQPESGAQEKSYGTITGLFTILVEGDDLNEPISDAVRGILDGHIVLSRDIAHRNRYPAVDVLGSISRMMPDCNDANQNALIDEARKYLSTYRDMEELIRIGAYRTGSNPEVDAAILRNPTLEQFLSQKVGEAVPLEQCFADLKKALDVGEESSDNAQPHGEESRRLDLGKAH